MRTPQQYHKHLGVVDTGMQVLVLQKMLCLKGGPSAVMLTDVNACKMADQVQQSTERLLALQLSSFSVDEGHDL